MFIGNNLNTLCIQIRFLVDLRNWGIAIVARNHFKMELHPWDTFLYKQQGNGKQQENPDRKNKSGQDKLKKTRKEKKTSRKPEK